MTTYVLIEVLFKLEFSDAEVTLETLGQVCLAPLREMVESLVQSDDLPLIGVHDFRTTSGFHLFLLFLTYVYLTL